MPDYYFHVFRLYLVGKAGVGSIDKLLRHGM